MAQATKKKKNLDNITFLGIKIMISYITERNGNVPKVIMDFLTCKHIRISEKNKKWFWQKVGSVGPVKQEIKSIPPYVNKCEVLPLLATCDHSPALCSLKFKVYSSKSYKRKIWLYDRADIAHLRDAVL